MFQTYTAADTAIYSVERADRSVHNFSDTRYRISNNLNVTRTTSRSTKTFEVHVNQDIRDGKVHEDHRVSVIYNEAGNAVRSKQFDGYREAALRFLEIEEKQAAEEALETAEEQPETAEQAPHTAEATDTPAEPADAEQTTDTHLDTLATAFNALTSEIAGACISRATPGHTSFINAWHYYRVNNDTGAVSHIQTAPHMETTIGTLDDKMVARMIRSFAQTAAAHEYGGQTWEIQQQIDTLKGDLHDVHSRIHDVQQGLADASVLDADHYYIQTRA